jgi:quercetin dioxygenase-like cupin family protein
MTLIERWAYVLAVICYAPLPPEPPPAPAPAAQHEHASQRSRTVLSQPLPRLKGDSLRVQMVEVCYGPGESNAAHSHPCPVIGYVLTGAVRMQVQDLGSAQPGPITVYRAGESFYEAPNGRHLVSANASQTEPATFLATFVCDHATELSVPASSPKGDSHP